RLHVELEQPNGEGMSDLLLYGASVRRVARRTPDGSFFAPAGTPVIDSRSALASRRWNVLIQGFRRAKAHLLVFLPLDESGSESLLARAERVLLLAGHGEASVPLSGAAP